MIKLLLEPIEVGGPAKLIVGLTPRNLEQLRQGDLCEIDMTGLGVNTEIVLMCGPSDAGLVERLEAVVGPIPDDLRVEQPAKPPESHAGATEPETVKEGQHG